MAKNNRHPQKQKQKQKQNNSSSSNQKNQPKAPNKSSTNATVSPPSSIKTNMVQPEQMSLTAYEHIQNYLGDNPLMEEKELTAILRLSTHLRVFGLLSAVGYINQTNDQGGDVRQRTIPVWRSLLGQLIDNNKDIKADELMKKVQQMAQNNSTEYMRMWRKALAISSYWNFWGRAYKQSD